MAFNNDLLQIDWVARSSAGKSFSCFYNKQNKLVNKHAPLEAISRRKAKQLAKAWITSSLRKSIKIKNALFRAGDTVKYTLYRNKISSLTRLSKKLYYHAYFEENLNNMKNQNLCRLLSDQNNQGLTQNSSELLEILNRISHR